MKNIFLLATLLSAFMHSLRAQEVANAPVMATKTALVTGLKEAQGLALDKDGNILVAEYKGGQISKFSPTGQPLGAFATGLKSPSLIVKSNGAFYVADRQANRVLKIDEKGAISPVGGEIAEPLGLTAAPDGTLFVVSHTTSKVFRFDGAQWQPIYEAPAAPGGEKRYGYRCLAYDKGTLLMSDEVSGNIFTLTQGGRLAVWAKELDNPSGIVIGPDGSAYATNESSGGQLLKLSNEGSKTVIAEGLGRPREILFVDAHKVLVSDRNGTLWQVTLP